MDNEKELMGQETEEVTEVVEEITEEVIEEVAEESVSEEAEEVVAEESEMEIVVEEAPVKKTLSKVYLCDECGAVTECEICPVCQKELTIDEAYVCKAETEVLKNKKTVKNVIKAVVAVAAVAVIAVVGVYGYRNWYNPYNHTKAYKDINFGDTIGDVIEEYGITLEEYLKGSNLPSDMAKSTYVYVANQFVPVASAIEGSGMTAQQYINDIIGMEGEFSDDVTVGEIESKMTLKQMLGVETEEDLEKAKEQYGIRKEATLDTLFEEVRADVYKKIYENQQKEEAEEKAAAQAEAEMEAEAKEAEANSETEKAEEAPEAE